MVNLNGKYLPTTPIPIVYTSGIVGRYLPIYKTVNISVDVQYQPLGIASLTGPENAKIVIESKEIY